MLGSCTRIELKFNGSLGTVHAQRRLQWVLCISFQIRVQIPLVALNICLHLQQYLLMMCRISALFYTDRICMEPLTEYITMLDFLDTQPERMYQSARILHALALGLMELDKLYKVGSSAHDHIALAKQPQ